MSGVVTVVPGVVTVVPIKVRVGVRIRGGYRGGDSWVRGGYGCTSGTRTAGTAARRAVTSHVTGQG